MGEVNLVITRQTTMWRAWIGFNASHSMGAILFGLVYGFLANAYPELLVSRAVHRNPRRADLLRAEHRELVGVMDLRDARALFARDWLGALA